ncbi:hypothetical protein FACS189418_1320 [Clostridia bacterium]|nr:hypothetical protein FACS189418_1320 [Clostridia bacterium]
MKCITDYLLKPENRIQLYVNFFHDPFYGDQEKSLWIVRSDGWNIHDPMLQHYLSTYGKKALRGHYQEISMERYQEEAQHNLARGRDWTGEKLGPLVQLLSAINKGGLGVQRIMNESGATSAVHTIMGAASYYKGAWEQHNLKQPIGKNPEGQETKRPESLEKNRTIGDPNAADKLDNLDFFEQQHPEFWDDKMEKEYNDLQRQQSNFDRSQSMNAQTSERLSEVNTDLDVSPGKSGSSGKIEYPLSNSNKQHINKHNIESIKQQSTYLTDTQLAEKLEDSFFNSNWSKDDINKYAEEAYNALHQQGKTGNLTYEVNGETLDVFIHSDGRFGTVYGRHKFTVEQVRNMEKER